MKKINIITLLLTVMFLCFCCSFTLKKYNTYKNMQNEENRIIELDTISYELETTTEAVPLKNYEADTAAPVSADYTTVKNTNSEIIGWLSFPSVAINVPLLKGTDNDFYLKHSYNQKFTWSGSIFMDYRLPSDLSAQNTLIYGHHMNDGSGFSNLFAYENKEFYNSADNFIYINTAEQSYTYQVFSVAEEEGGTIYTQRVFDSVSYDDFIENVADASMYDTGVAVSSNDKIISLITCLTDSSSHMRLIIYAKLLN